TNVGSSALGGIVGSNPSDEKAAEDKRSPSSNQPNLSSIQTESQDSSNRNDESILTKVTNMGSSALGSVVGSNDKAAESQRSPSSNQHNDESFITKVTNMGSSALGGIVGSNPSDNTATEGQHNPSSNQPDDESYLTKVTNKGSSALGGIVGSNPSD
ncbi:10287_t:CDS:2, partial [Funneliformis mosseae]